MKWVKFLKEDGDRKLNEVVQIEDGEYATLKRLKFVEDAAEPAEVTAAAVDADALAAGREAAESFIGEFRKSFAAEVKSAAKRPGIVVHDANELADPTDGFKTLGDHLAAVRKACAHQGVDERLSRRVKANGNQENVNADGGYAVPVQYAEGVWSDATAQPSLMNDCFRIPMSGNSIRIPAVNYTQQGDYAGVAANWEGEGAGIPPSKAKFRQPQLTLNKLTVLVPVTNELLEDAPAAEAIISNLAGQAITYKINDAIFNGTGAGMPQGIIAHPSIVAVGRQTANSFTATDAIKMKSRFDSPLGTSPKFYANKDVDPSLYTIQDGAGRYLYFAPGTFAQSPDGRLLGYDHVPTINCQSLGTPGDVVLADLSQYAFGYKSTGVNKAMSIHVFFATDEVAYRWTFRADGRPMRDTPVKAAKGNNTYSPIVVLQ